MAEALFQLISLLGLGFVLGLKHALDADHVAAISTIVSQTRSLRRSSLFGAFWGIGHTTTLLIIGFLILALKLAIPDKVALSFEFLVGIVLIVLGMDLLRKVVKDRVHLHQHRHGKIIHAHLHSHETPSHAHSHKPFAVGMIHGLAGSASLMLLVLATVKSILQGLLFILVFGVGSILSMMIISTVIGLPFIFSSRSTNVNDIVKVLAGASSTLLGFATIYGILTIA